MSRVNYMFVVFLVAISFARQTHARKSTFKNNQACNKFLNEGWLRDYKYMGVGDPHVADSPFDLFGASTENTSNSPSSEATKKEGSIQGTSTTTTEDSTASSDPKQWTNHGTYLTNVGFSTGSMEPCKYSFWASTAPLRENRNYYFAQNSNQILKEISEGKGEHLNVLASLSLCDKDSYQYFSEKLQNNIDIFLKPSDKKSNGDIIDQLIQKDKILAESCHLKMI